VTLTISSLGEVGIVKHDPSTVTAKLEGHLLERARALRHEELANSRGARE